MEILISNWCDVQSLPKSYVFPPNRRPGEINAFPVCKNIPIINLEKAEAGHDRVETIQKILNACQEFGFFQVINHRVAESLMDDTMSIFKEFFALPAEYKASFYSNDINKSCRIYSSTLKYDAEEFHYWRDNFTHRCHPIEDHIQQWPDRPAEYRKVVGEYCVEVRKFLMRILSLISKGLGVEPGYFEGDLSKTQLISVNHHIPCPDPSLTLGVPEHCDPNLISMLQQCSVPGLQVFSEGRWMGVEPLPNAFLVIPGLQLKVISNGKFTSPLHRVVTHSNEARTTIGSFLNPSQDVVIEPAPSSDSPPVYHPFTYKEFLSTFTGNNCNAVALDYFKNKPK